MAEMQRLGPLLADLNRRATDTSSGNDASEPLIEDASARLGEGSPDCELCGGAGYVRVSRPVDDPDFGRVQHCECRRAEQEALAAARLQRLSNLGPLSEARLSEEEAAREPAAAACAFADALDDEPGWMLLTGSAGSGRTRLSAEMANRRIAAGRSALYFVAADLLDRLRAAMNASSGGDFSYALLFEHVRDSALLILDDLDCISATDWAREKLFQLLNHRRNSGRRTVLISELADLSAIGLQSFLTPDVVRLELGGVDSGGRYLEFGGMTEAVLAQYTFAGFKVDWTSDSRSTDNLRTMRDGVMEWAEQPSGFITLYGETGVGKTHLAAAAAWHRLRQGDSVCFAVVPELLDALRASYRDDGETTFESSFSSIKDVDVLVLDDLGAHQSTAWAKEKLYQLCAYRYLQQMPTLVTMNVRPDELEPRLASRLMDQNPDRCKQFRCTASVPDFRTGMAHPQRRGTPRAKTPPPARGLNDQTVGSSGV